MTYHGDAYPLRAARRGPAPCSCPSSFMALIAMALRRALDPQLFALVVNGDYPAGASRPTMRGSVLKTLPPLPMGLEYRIVDTHPLLMDRDANIVVDYVLDVMCKTC